ncbi:MULTISPECIES: hypothetical protein [Nocardia]|uniref:Acyl-CoA thioester hydrolase n=1 Tax=Nocardia elegans TaxID=300029 RepID=A0ABW6TLA3_9NOCA|nr:MULTISPECIES: hypothetical protein [Nocardia]
MSVGIEVVDALVETTGRPHLARSHLGLYPLVRTSQGRYADMDANAHLNNLALELLHEDAHAVLNAKVFPGVYDPRARQLRLVASQNVVHFRAEAHWPATIETGAWAGSAGPRS